MTESEGLHEHEHAMLSIRVPWVEPPSLEPGPHLAWVRNRATPSASSSHQELERAASPRVPRHENAVDAGGWCRELDYRIPAIRVVAIAQ